MFRIRRVRPFVLIALLAAVGCGRAGFHPVRGQFVNEDGQPVTELADFQVIFEGKAPDGKQYSAVGTIDKEGRFELYTDQPGDGAPLGMCKVLVSPNMIDSEREAPYPLDRKYRSFDTSELTAEVKAESNAFTFPVAMKKSKPKDKAK